MITTKELDLLDGSFNKDGESLLNERILRVFELAKADDSDILCPDSIDCQIRGDDNYYLELTREYEPVSCHLGILLGIGEIFQTRKIDICGYTDREGCETCGYGSRYGYTLKIMPE